MSRTLLEKRLAEGEGELESERKKPYCEDSFHPATLSYLIDDYLLNSDGLDLYNQDYTKKNPPAAAAEEPIMNIDETEEPMRLLISNGCEICVVDIKQPKGCPRREVDYVRKIATLNLAEEQLPVSVGLFRRGSYAYMIGGQSFPTSSKAYHSVAGLYDVKGTSRDTYHLSIDNNGTLSASKRNDILRLQSPKLWPVVAEIKGKIHVFDCFPSAFLCDDPDWRFSHEVISVSDHESSTIETPLYYFILSHLVLGDNIFAVTCEHVHLLFTQINLEWDFDNGICCGFSSGQPRSAKNFENVWDILCSEGEAMCVEEIWAGNDSYYLVLTLDDIDSVIVMAYLVTSKGDIVGRQTLRGFFMGPIKPLSVYEGAIIKGGGTDGKTMCIALTGNACIDGIYQEEPMFFFSNTFSVNLLLNNADSSMKHILEAGLKQEEIAIDGKLVHIDIKDRCVYKIKENDNDLTYPRRMEACFF